MAYDHACSFMLFSILAYREQKGKPHGVAQDGAGRSKGREVVKMKQGS
jgi:hypothetical protein